MGKSNIKPKKEVREPVINYLDMVKYIEKKYKIGTRSYHEKYSKKNKDWKEYMDFWHWMLGNCFYEIHNPCDCYWNMKEIIEDEDTPNWIKEITQLFYDNFKDDLDEDGGLEVHISW